MTAAENDLWMTIFKMVAEGRGDTVLEQWYEDNEKYKNVYCGIWQNCIRAYMERVSHHRL